MVMLSITLGVLLTLLGAVGYIVSGGESITALIPAFLGIPITALGTVARRENLRKHMMHAVTLLALIGFAGSARGIASVVNMISGSEIARPLAAVMQTIMALLTLGFVVLAVKSFIDARRHRVLSDESAR